MSPDLQRRVQRYGWDKASAYYEKHWEEQLKPAQDLLIELSDLKKDEKVLDTACGTGLVTLKAAERVGTGGFVLGTDISDKMIESANQISDKNNIQNVDYKRMDAEDLKLEDETFDAALCALGMMYYPDPLKAFMEMKRVVKSGGRVAAAVWGERNNCGWAEIFPIVDSRVETDVCPLFFQLGTAENLKLVMAQAGLSNIKVKKINTRLDYKNDEEAVGAVFAGGPVAMAYSRFDEKTKVEAHKEYINSILKFKNGIGYNIPGEFIIAVGCK